MKGPADVERCARHKLRKGQCTRGNARAKGANWTKITEIRTKFVRISYDFHISRIFTRMIFVKFVRNSCEIRTNLVRISYEFHVNFVQFANKQSKHTSEHTLHSHGQVLLHAPVFPHLGNRHAGTVFTRCHSVLRRSGGHCRSPQSGSPTPHRHCPPCRPPVGARCPRRTACTARRPQ